MRIGDRDGIRAEVPRSLLLHCFHHAGGSPAAFRRWTGAFAGVDVAPADVERADGLGQPTIESLVDEWRRRTVERSGVYYGHSMGALVAYEAAARALARDEPRQVPRALVLAAPPAPGRPVPGSAVHASATVDGSRLHQGLERVRRHRLSRARLPIPVHVLWGALDDVVPEPEARSWVLRGSEGSTWHLLQRAGHLFHHMPGPEVRSLLEDLLRRDGEDPS